MQNNYLKQYIFRGALTASLIPVLGFIPELGWLLISIYSIPALLIEKLLGLKNVLVVNQEIVVYPHAIGFVVTILFWLIMGALIGWLVFYNTKLRVKKKGIDIPPYRWRAVGETIAWIVALYILFIGLGSFIFS